MAPDSATTVDAEDGDDALPPVHLNRDFRVLWLARTLGQTAANTAQFGSLIVIVEETGSGFLSSVVVLSWVLPGALVSVLSGIVVDAVPKTWLLAVANGLRAVGCSCQRWGHSSVRPNRRSCRHWCGGRT